MKLMRRFPMLAFTVVLLSIATACIVQQSMAMLLTAGTLAAISWYITEGPRGRTLPRWVSNVLVIGITMYVFVDLFQNRHELLAVLGRFAVWLTIIKLYERRTARDYGQLLSLSLMLMMTACLQSNELIVGILLSMYATLGLYVLLLYQVYAAFEREQRHREAVLPTTQHLLPALRPITGLHLQRSFGLQTLGIAMVGAVISVAVFMVFPRDVGAGMLGMMRMTSATKVTQFSDSIDLKIGGRITESRAKVMTVQFADAQGRRFQPPSPIMLRGAAVARYQGNGRWGGRSDGADPAANDRAELVAGEWAALTTRPVESNDLITQRIVPYRLVHGVQPLFSVFAPVALKSDSRLALRYNPRSQTFRTDDHHQHITAYDMRIHTNPSDDLLMRLCDPIAPIANRFWMSAGVREELNNITAVRLRAANISVERPDNMVAVWEWNRSVAAALTRYFHAGEFSYTTDLSSVVLKNPEQDPVVSFLTEVKRGHCEFFAAGLATLCNSMGIPARIVAGYVTYDYDATNQYFNVLEANAHAWVEVATGPNRWTAFDPTPPSTLQNIHGSPTTLADQMRWAYQRLEGDWSNTVVRYDGVTQSQIADTLYERWARRIADVMQSARDGMDRVNTFFNVGPGGYIWIGTVALALVIAVIAGVKMIRRTWQIRRVLQLQHVRGSRYHSMLRQLGFYLDMLAVLQRAGITKPDWQPPLQFAAQLQRENGDAARLVEQITGLFYHARYGEQPLTAEQFGAAQQFVRQLATRLHVRI